MRRTLSRSALVLLATASLATSVAVVAQEQNPPEQSTPVLNTHEQGTGLPAGQLAAVLKSREVDFIYRSSVNLFSCDQLRNHIAAILREVGARDDVQVKAHECETFIPEDPRSTSNSSPSVYGSAGGGGGSSWDPMNRTNDKTADRMRMTHADRYDRYQSQSTPVHIQVMMPVVVTPEVVDEVEKDKSRRALISRVTGNQSVVMDDPVFFPAHRREVTLSHDSIGLESIDCELLEQMTVSVFRALDLKVTTQALSCDARERSHFKPHLTVEALLPVGYLMPGEQKARERAQKAAQRKASENPPQPETPSQ